MTVDISGAVGDAAKFGANAFVDAVYTAGENSEMFRAIAVHSMIEARMVKNDELDIVETAQGGTKIKTYKGRAVIVDDSLTVSGAGADRVYTSVLFGGGAIGFGGVEGNAFALGEGVPKVAAEVSRTAEAGNGGGMESIWERRTWMMHPFGFEWVESGAAMAEMSPTLADLRKAAFWNRVVDRKQVPLAFIKSKA
jgi:hypothetical protein